jgi:hypothetical protein
VWTAAVTISASTTTSPPTRSPAAPWSTNSSSAAPPATTDATTHRGYLALSQAGAVAEVLGNHAEWVDGLFDVPGLGLRRHLLTVEIDDTIVARIVDVDDARFLLDRGLRPSEIAGRARTRTRSLAADLFSEGATGIRFWSYHRPEWTNAVLFVPPFTPDHVGVASAEEMHLDMPCVAAASQMLCRPIRR